MKKLILLFSLFMIGFTSCQKEEIKPKEDYFFTIVEFTGYTYDGFKPAQAYVNSIVQEDIQFTTYTNDIVQVYSENSNLAILKSNKYYSYEELFNYIIIENNIPIDVEIIEVQRENTPLNPELVYFEIMP